MNIQSHMMYVAEITPPTESDEFLKDSIKISRIKNVVRKKLSKSFFQITVSDIWQPQKLQYFQVVLILEKTISKDDASLRWPGLYLQSWTGRGSSGPSTGGKGAYFQEGHGKD